MRDRGKADSDGFALIASIVFDEFQRGWFRLVFACWRNVVVSRPRNAQLVAYDEA